MKNNGQADTLLTLVLNALFQVQPRNIENVPQINQVRQSNLRQSSSLDQSIACSIIYVISITFGRDKVFCWIPQFTFTIWKNHRGADKIDGKIPTLMIMRGGIFPSQTTWPFCSLSLRSIQKVRVNFSTPPPDVQPLTFQYNMYPYFYSLCFVSHIVDPTFFFVRLVPHFLV